MAAMTNKEKLKVLEEHSEELKGNYNDMYDKIIRSLDWAIKICTKYELERNKKASK